MSHLIYTFVSKEAIMVKVKAAEKPTAEPASGRQAPTPLAGNANSSEFYPADPRERIEVIRRGIPAARIGQLATRMGMSKEHLINSLRLSRATINRKERDGSALSRDESERVLGVQTLIHLVQTMVEQSGIPDGFDAPRWVSTWLAQPLPALGGAAPASYMDTFEGQKLVSELLAMSQSGAYA
jgi:putative toxin-antitoxin system antitoxin component (TIGR02293 family)